MSVGTRGRVLLVPAGAGTRDRGAGLRIGIVLGAAFGLILFGGLFQYVIDLKPLYLLAKAWPAITLPLTVFAVLRSRPSYQPLLLAACGWMMAATPFIGVAQLGNDAVGALASTVKIWPLTGALGGLAALSWIRPMPDEVRRAVAIVAVATFVFLAGAWVFAPDTAFEQTIETTKVFLSDAERGRRINAPMMVAILGLFALNRSMWRGGWGWPAVGRAVLIVVGLALMVGIYKQRAQIAGTGLVLILGAVLSWGRWRGPALIALAAGAVALVVPVWLWLQAGSAVESLGGSLSMRQNEATAALNFLNAEPWRWVTGVGSATRIGGVTLGDIVGTPFFFPSDLGWLGVVFEYGLVGAVLMLALHLTAIRLGWRAIVGEPVLGGAVFDYAVFMLVISPIISVALSPGELATCLALAVWLIRVRISSDPSYAGPGCGS